MSSLKNPTLRKRTKELSECAEDARECQLLGYELKDLGSLLVKMAIHMEDLQRKVDSQAEYIKTLNEDRKTEPSDSEKPNNCETCKRWDCINGKWECVLNECRYKPKDEPQTEYPCNTCANKGDHNGECSNCVADSEPIRWKTPSHYKPKTEPQTDLCDGCVCDDGKHLMYCMNCKGIAWKTEPPKVEDEPQTDCAWGKGEE